MKLHSYDLTMNDVFTRLKTITSNSDINYELEFPLHSNIDIEIGERLIHIGYRNNTDSYEYQSFSLLFSKNQYNNKKEYAIACENFLNFKVVVSDKLLTQLPNLKFKPLSHLDENLGFRYNLDEKLDNSKQNDMLFWSKESLQTLGHFITEVDQFELSELTLTCVGYYFIKDDNRKDKNGNPLPKLKRYSYIKDEYLATSRRLRELDHNRLTTREIYNERKKIEKELKTIKNDYQDVFNNINGHLSFYKQTELVPVFLIEYERTPTSCKQSIYLNAGFTSLMQLYD